MEYKLISVLGYDEFCLAMTVYFNAGWGLYMNVVITPTYRTEGGSRIDYEMYTQWMMRNDVHTLDDENQNKND